MEQYLSNAPCLYFSASDDGTILEVNDMLCAQTGFRLNELVGAGLESIFTVATRIFHQTHFFPLLRMQGHAEEIFITLQTKDKEQVPVLVNATRQITNGSGTIAYAGIVVHHRKKFEDELVAAKKAAEAALNENTALLQARQALQMHTERLDRQMILVKKQNDELRQFNHAVTHDLQEPLRKLFIFTNMMLEADEITAAKARTKITAVAEQMRSIVSGLQQFIWLTESSLRPERIDLARLLSDVTEQVVAENPDVAVNIEVHTLPALEGSREQLLFLLYELICNAVRFRKDERVKIEVSGETLMLNKFRQLQGKYKYTEFIKLLIKDDGVGFDTDFSEKALELFRKLHANSGRGVGLALCKKNCREPPRQYKHR